MFKIKPYDETLGLSVLVDLYNQSMKYFNPETTLEITEELVQVVLGKDTVLSRDYLIFEDMQGKIIACIGISKVPMYKGALLTVYGILPEYMESELPGELIDAILDLGKRLKVPELLFQTIGKLAAPFDKKLESLGFSPVNYAWSMRLTNFNFFSHPGVPQGITIRNLKQIDDYASIVNVINEAFQDSFKFEPITKIRWKRLYEEVKKVNVVESCVAFENDRIIGFLDTYLRPTDDQSGTIADFGILPSHQHRKIGSALLATGIETLRKKGCKTIKLGVHTTNEKALGLYKKFGFYVKENLTEKIYQII
ncbi:MAG: GNAT family N-acetyltransferase [Candidatus Odinarchaeota archaeon]